MSADELFQILLRTMAALVWIVVVYRVTSRRMQADKLDALVTAITLATTLSVVAIGGALGFAGAAPAELIRIAYTATASLALATGVVVLTR